MIHVLNLGCGTNPLFDNAKRQYFNVDAILLETKARYLQADITKLPILIEPLHFDEIYLFHCIEHIPEDQHRKVLMGIRFHLKPSGKFVISYPEFRKCAINYLENKNGQRDFWKATIYGRGLTEWDRHKALMDTHYFKHVLRECGLFPVKIYAEKREDYNTVIVCEANVVAPTYEELLGRDFAKP